MGKTVMNMDRMQQNTPPAYFMEPTARKVLSRYLRAPTGSCHDNCKPGTKQTTETKPINPFPKRSPIAPADRTRVNVPNPAPTIKKAPSTRDLKNNTTNVFKDDVLKGEVLMSSSKKDNATEPKRQDSKPKHKNSHDKTCFLSSSRTPNRRHSESFLPSNDVSLPSSRITKRRLSDVSPVVGLSSSKNESRKSELKGSRKSKPGAKVLTFRTHNNLPKPELKGSRKSKPAKPIEPFTPEKTLHVVELNQSQSPVSPASPSSCEEKVVRPNDNRLQLSSPSMEDDTRVTDGQNNSNVADSGVENTKRTTRAGKLVETSDSSPGTLKFCRGTITDPSESSGPRKLKFREGKLLDKTEHHSVKTELKHQDMEEKKEASGLSNNIIEETASKLIRTRKSKVKALVGAFEDVFSSDNDTKTVDK